MRFRVEDPFGPGEALPWPMAVAFEEAGGGREDVVAWGDAETDVAGICGAGGRVAWRRSRLRAAHGIQLRPGTGGGAVGVEIEVEGREEAGVLVGRPFREEAARWLRDQRGRLEEVWGIPVGWRDYGWDRP
jgi:hypothetical protein